MRIVKSSIIPISVTLTIVLLPFLSMKVVNADLYGRLTEKVTVNHMGIPMDNSNKTPTVRFILHKILDDENAVEASIMIYVDDYKTVDLVREGKLSISTNIRDGYNFQPFGISHDITLNKITANSKIGVNPVAVQSGRFLFPTAPTIDGFPFDDILIRPFVSLSLNNQPTMKFNFEVQKALPGRLLRLYENDNNMNKGIVKLTRTPTEKTLIIVSSLIFLLISLILCIGLMTSKNGLSRVEELVAVAGYLIATAGFRELIGFSRSSGMSALEIAIIGVPLVLLFIAMTVSFIRGLREKRRNEQKVKTTANNALKH